MTTASDAFTGTNGDGLPTYSSNWAYVAGSGADYQIQSNELSWDGTSNADICCRWTADTWGNDHYSKLVIASSGVTADGMGVAVRCQAAASGNYYGFYIQSNGDAAWLFRDTFAAEFGNTGSGFAGANLAANDTVALYNVGQALLPLLNGELYQRDSGAQREYGVIDSTHTSGVPGLAAWDGNTGQNTSGDNWTAGTLQHALIDAEIGTSGWSGEYTDIDEAATAISTTDTIGSGANPSSVAGLYGLANLTDPSESADHIVMVYFQHNGGGRELNLTVDLVENPGGTPTNRASRTFDDLTSAITAWQLLGFELTASEANAITDYTDLALRFTITAIGGGATTTGAIAWATFACPEAAAGGADPEAGLIGGKLLDGGLLMKGLLVRT